MCARLILHVDDEPDDAFLIRRIFERTYPQTKVVHIESGEGAILYLQNADYATPDLVLLDLKMGRLSGFDVLQWIRTQQRYASLPVIVLSASEIGTDIEKAIGMGATAYVAKPADYKELADRIREICCGLFEDC